MYFSNLLTAICTLMIIGILGFIICLFFKRENITNWGRYIIITAVVGLALCCFVAARDSYHLSVQASMDADIQPGLFSIDSLQSSLCCIGGGIIFASLIVSAFVKKQQYRKLLFFIMSAVVIMKIIIIELSRIGGTL